jgi:hypothetical protein
MVTSEREMVRQLDYEAREAEGKAPVERFTDV